MVKKSCESSVADTGRRGEDAVCRYLQARGHRILSRNCHCGHLELDIVSQSLQGVHFVEVKTRRPPLQAEPQASVTPLKQHRIAKAAKAYMARCKDPLLQSCEYHFDVAAVVVEGDRTNIQYFADAFIPIYY